jgi:predicted phage-related endonuclease
MPTLTTTLDETGLAYVRDLAAKRAAKREAEAAEKRAAEKVREYLGSADMGLDEHGEPVVRKTVVVSHRLDTKRLRAQEPEIAEAFTVESESVRVDLA